MLRAQKLLFFWERFSPNGSIKCERVELQNAIFNNCSTHSGLRPLEIGGNLPGVDITHRPRRRAKLCPVGPISMCNCNAFVVVLLTPWGPRTRPGPTRPGQMDYEIARCRCRPLRGSRVRKVFNLRKCQQNGVPEKQSFRFTLFGCRLEFREFMHDGHTLNS